MTSSSSLLRLVVEGSAGRGAIAGLGEQKVPLVSFELVRVGEFISAFFGVCSRMDNWVLLRQYMVASRMLKDAFLNPGELGLRAPGPAALNVSPMQSCVFLVSAT